MTNLKTLRDELTTFPSEIDVLIVNDTLSPEWIINASEAKVLSDDLRIGIETLSQQVQQVINSYSKLHQQEEIIISSHVRLIQIDLKQADNTAHKVQNQAGLFSASIEPLIGQLDLLKTHFDELVKEANAAKVNVEHQVNKLQYAIDHAGKWVPPYFGPGEMQTRKSVYFPVDTSSTQKRLKEVSDLRLQATVKENELIIELNRFNLVKASLDHLLETEELLNSCRMVLTRLDGDIEEAIKKEDQIVLTGSESLREFYTQKLSSSMEEIIQISGQ